MGTAASAKRSGVKGDNTCDFVAMDMSTTRQSCTQVDIGCVVYMIAVSVVSGVGAFKIEGSLVHHHRTKLQDKIFCELSFVPLKEYCHQKMPRAFFSGERAGDSNFGEKGETKERETRPHRNLAAT